MVLFADSEYFQCGSGVVDLRVEGVPFGGCPFVVGHTLRQGYAIAVFSVPFRCQGCKYIGHVVNLLFNFVAKGSDIILYINEFLLVFDLRLTFVSIFLRLAACKLHTCTEQCAMFCGCFCYRGCGCHFFIIFVGIKKKN